MNINQERKYEAVDGKLVNRDTGIAIPDDEPVIVFRAKDRNSIGAMFAYLSLCTNKTHRNVIHERIQAFAAWQQANPKRVREPDSHESCLEADQQNPKPKTSNVSKDDLLAITLESGDDIMEFLKQMGGRNHLIMAADYKRLLDDIQNILA
jgi:hypothetical protein